MSKPAKGLIKTAEAALSEFRERVAGRRPKGRYYLIVCEGTKTEPNYFESIRSHLSGGEGDKVVIVGSQSNTLGLVERAKAEIAARNARAEAAAQANAKRAAEATEAAN